MTKRNLDKLKELNDEIQSKISDAEYIIRCENQSLYERWKAYGLIVNDDIVSMGPSLSGVIEELENEVEE